MVNNTDFKSQLSEIKSQDWRGNRAEAVREFVEDVFEIAFGADAIDKGYSADEVIAELMRFSELALAEEERLGLI